jgi:hypothetical protein
MREIEGSEPDWPRRRGVGASELGSERVSNAESIFAGRAVFGPACAVFQNGAKMIAVTRFR